MTIKAIEARFTSGNDIPVQKAMVPADEWHMAMAEIQVLKDQFIWDKMAFEKLEKLCDERGRNEMHMFMRCRELAEQVAQLQEQNSLIDEKLAEAEKEVERLQQANRDLSDWFEAAKADAERWSFIEVAATPIVARVATLVTNQRGYYVDACIKESKT